jgi:TolB protein
MLGDFREAVLAAERLAFTSLLEGNQDIHTCILKPERNGCTDGTIVRLTNIPLNDGQPTWAPDSTQISFESNLAGNWDIYMIQSNGTGQTQLTTSPSVDGAPSWKQIPELGWRVVFHSNRNGRDFDLFIVDSQNPEDMAALTNEVGDELYPSLSHDGRLLAYATNVSGEFDIYIADVVVDQGKVVLFNPRPLTDNIFGDSIKPVWSPDGSSILFQNNGTGNNDIYVMTTEGSSEAQNLTQNAAEDEHPDWSPDGRYVVFQSNRNSNYFSIYVMRQDGSNPVQIISYPVADIVHPAWMP